MIQGKANQVEGLENSRGRKSKTNNFREEKLKEYKEKMYKKRQWKTDGDERDSGQCGRRRADTENRSGESMVVAQRNQSSDRGGKSNSRSQVEKKR